MAQGQEGAIAAPNTLPGDFFDKQNAPDILPGNFFDKKQSISAKKGLPAPTIGPPTVPKITPENAETFLSRPNGPLSRYMLQARNLTVEGAKEHPVQNFIGRTANRADLFKNILGTMSGLFMGPEGMMPASGLHETPLPEPITAKQLPAARSIQAPASSLEPPLSMRERVGAKLPQENMPTLTNRLSPARETSAPVPASAMPARTPPVGAPTLEPRPTVVTGPATPPSTRSLVNRLGQQIEDSAKYPAVEPIARARPAGGTVGAKQVTAEPNTEIGGPAIRTPSRSETLLENMKNRVPASRPLKSDLPIGDQSSAEIRIPAQVKEETVHPMTRQSIHVNGARATELTEGKPGLRNDLLDLEGEQLREVLRKSGEDMTNIQSVGKSAGKSGGFAGGKIVDPKNISRQEAFEILFGKGYTPEQIVKEAPLRSKLAPPRKPFGPPLKNPLIGGGL